MFDSCGNTTRKQILDKKNTERSTPHVEQRCHTTRRAHVCPRGGHGPMVFGGGSREPLPKPPPRGTKGRIHWETAKVRCVAHHRQNG
jgi:hypothetical protein